MRKVLMFIASNPHSSSRTLYPLFSCPRRFSEGLFVPLSHAMAVTRSSKRRPEASKASAAKRQTTADSKVTPTGNAEGPTEENTARKPEVNTEKASASVSPNRPSYYLFKSEPESRIQHGHEMKFSIDDLAAEPDQTTHWDGVRNAEARNTMKAMKKGDLGFFYHSNTKKSRPGIIGIVEVVKEAYPDHTAFDKNDPHFDPKSSKDAPKWFMVDVRLVEKFTRCITLDEVKKNAQLVQMPLVKRGRISVQRVSPGEWDVILKMAKESPDQAS